LHQTFPGFSMDTNSGAGPVFDDALVRETPDRQLRLLAKANVKAAIAEGAGMYADAARSVAETGRCRAILCAHPEKIREHDSQPPATISKTDRRPHLTETDARKLLSDALAEQLPA
jgi:hypothetical protein